jgi:Ran GTPase-activating protein (RanGAP) involved in mRNA processing and transport
VDAEYPLRRLEGLIHWFCNHHLSMLMKAILKCKTLEEFAIVGEANYSDRVYRADGYVELVRRSETLKKIYLGKKVFEDDALSKIFRAVGGNSVLREIELSNSHFLALSLLAITEMLMLNCTLQVLILKNCSILDGAASLIAEGLKHNSSIEVLDLSNNKIANYGAQSIAEALEINYSLRELDLSNNKIKLAGANAFARMLTKNQSIQQLNLSSNMFQSEGTLMVINALKANNSLLGFSIRGNYEKEKEHFSVVAQQISENANYRKRHLNFLSCAYLFKKNVHFEGNILRHQLFPFLDSDFNSMEIDLESA